MGIIYLINPKKNQLKYIYDKKDLEIRIKKNKLRPENERVIPKAKAARRNTKARTAPNVTTQGCTWRTRVACSAATQGTTFVSFLV